MPQVEAVPSARVSNSETQGRDRGLNVTSSLQWGPGQLGQGDAELQLTRRADDSELTVEATELCGVSYT